MKHACVLALWLGIPAVAFADDASPEGRVAPTWSVARHTVHVGEVFRLELIVNLQPMWVLDRTVQRSAQALDLPLEIEATALKALSRATLLPALPAQPVPKQLTLPKSVALNGERVEVSAAFESTVSGWFRLERRWRANEPGTIEVPAATVRFSYANEFTEDALGTPVPVDTRQHLVRSEPLALTVVPLPTEGRPRNFGGAIGRFTMSAAAGRTEVEVGQTFRLTLTIGGEGNVEVFEPPRIPAEAGFHVYGVIDDRAYPKRTIVYDLAAQRADVTSVPAIELPVFDPEPPAGYRVLRTEPLPLTVRSSPDRLVIEPVRFEADGDGTGRRFRWLLGGACALLVVGGALWFLVRRRRRVESAPDPRTERLGAALGALRVAVADGADLSEAFAEVLAARLGSPRAAAIGPDLAARLTAAGVGPDDAREAARAMERLVAARYGGGVAAEDRDRILPLAGRVAGRTDDA